MSVIKVLIIDPDGEKLDVSPFILRSGYGWSRNDLDSEKTTRLKNTKIRRDKLGTKRSLSIELRATGGELTRERLAQLDDLLSKKIYTATYMDLHGIQTRNFYTTSFTTTLDEVDEDGELWSGASFDMIEE